MTIRFPATASRKLARKASVLLPTVMYDLREGGAGSPLPTVFKPSLSSTSTTGFELSSCTLTRESCSASFDGLSSTNTESGNSARNCATMLLPYSVVSCKGEKPAVPLLEPAKWNQQGRPSSLACLNPNWLSLLQRPVVALTPPILPLASYY